jgi:DNA-binding NarL/FixJ family response regulator
MKIKVLLVDDQEMVRKGFRLLLETEEDMEIVGEAENGAEAVTQSRRTKPDVVLMDIQMPVMDGLAATRQIVSLKIGTSPRVLILTTFEKDEYIFEALRSGASGFLLKNAPPEDLIDCENICS